MEEERKMEKERLKEIVKQKYSDIALQENAAASCCCSGPAEVYNIMHGDYTHVKGYNPDADLGLGCGLPTQYAGIKPGDTVIDLGSGAGNDCFVARAEAGEKGRVIGIDFTEAMIEKARENLRKRGYDNVSFRKGDIENMPVGGNMADVVISNCVLNLLPSKNKIFHEIFRVLKPGGHFCISDVVLTGELPEAFREAAEMYAGCVSGAIRKEEYLSKIAEAGFQEVVVQEEKSIIIPEEIAEKYLKPEELASFTTSRREVIRSVTVTGVKPRPGCCCGQTCC